MVYALIFSPTGGTAKAAEGLLSGWEEPVEKVDLCQKKGKGISFRPEDQVLLASPVYGGRIPAAALRRMASFQGNGARAVLLCVYGNRAYDNALAELGAAARRMGLQPVAAVTAVAEHVMERRIAAGRPDAADQETLKQFGQKIWEKIVSGDTKVPVLPGKEPTGWAKPMGVLPVRSKDCDGCQACETACPVGAYHLAAANRKACLSCQRCVQVCPQGALSLPGWASLGVRAVLSLTARKRKQPELFCKP